MSEDSYFDSAFRKFKRRVLSFAERRNIVRVPLELFFSLLVDHLPLPYQVHDCLLEDEFTSHPLSQPCPRRRVTTDAPKEHLPLADEGDVNRFGNDAHATEMFGDFDKTHGLTQDDGDVVIVDFKVQIVERAKYVFVVEKKIAGKFSVVDFREECACMRDAAAVIDGLQSEVSAQDEGYVENS